MQYHTVSWGSQGKNTELVCIPFSSGPRFVRTRHHDPSILGGPTQHGSWLHWVRQGCGPCDQIPQDWKRSVFVLIPKKGNAKECSNYCTIVLISHDSEVMLKILQARLQQYVNCELPDVEAGLRKAEEPEIKLPTSTGAWKKQESSRKTSISALLAMPKPLTVWITTNCGKFWKRWEYQTTWPASWETYMQVRNNS